MTRLLAVLIFASAAATAAAQPRVEHFHPQGEAKGVRQVTARFSEPMVAFGDPRLADPFTVQCTGDAAKLKGKGRWADTRNWSWDFEADLPAGQRCTFLLMPDAKSEGGQALTGQREFTFNTGGPLAVGTLPREGATVDEEQAFILAFDAPLDRASLKEGWCEAAGINERIPLVEIPQKETDEILAANKAHAFRFYRLLLKGPTAAIPLAAFRVEDKRFRQLPIVGVKCARRLPPDAELAVVIGEKVKTRTGMERGVAQRLAFKVRPAFNVNFSCQRVNKDAHCLPLTSMRLTFSAPVPAKVAAEVRLKRAGGQVIAPKVEEKTILVTNVEFPGPFAEGVKFTLELPRGFKDDVGREPRNLASFPLTVQTDSFPPLAKFPARFGILEASDPTLPVTVRAVEAELKAVQVDVVAPIPGQAARIEGDEQRILQRYFDYMKWGNDRAPGKKEVKPGEVSAIVAGDAAQPLAIPRPASHRMEVLGIPLKKPGFYIVELASPRLGAALHGEKDKPYHVSTSVLVTNLAVHLKQGRERSLVWVTRLADGKPVADAEVSVRDCRGRQHFAGKTDGDGVAAIDGPLPLSRSYPHCPLAAFARVGDDLSFTLSSWREGIEPSDYSLNVGYWQPSPLAIHTVFDRTLFRAGETVSMKHIARAPSGDGFKLPAATSLPRKVAVTHLGTDERVDIAVTFDAQGVAESRWRIPKEAKLGSYQLTWGSAGVRSNATFRVEAFRVPLMRATLAAPKAPLVKATQARLDAAVVYLAGGAAAGIPVRVRHRVEPRVPSYADYPDFQFTAEALKEGTQTGPGYRDFESYDPEDEAPEGEAGEGGGAPPATRTQALDAAGTAAIVIEKLPATDKPASLAVEMEYDDPNGERLVTSTRVPLHPAGVYVGIRPDGWAATKSGVNLQAVVLDLDGKPVANREVAIEVFERKVYSNRRRVLGGFYAYDSVTETKKVGQGCIAKTDTRGLVFCSAKPGLAGELIFRARALDDASRAAFATTSVWVVGDGDWWFDPSQADRIDLVPEKRRYEPGENARFQVRMPFRSATVLVTVEREGVLSHRIVLLDAKSPVIDVPMVGSYGPNVYVSALAVRGRVPAAEKGPRPTGLVDLSKPAYKLGMAEVRVGRRAYELDVKVTAASSTYRVREKAHVSIEVKDPAGNPAANAEIALAAVDEGLLELSDNASWNILEALMGQRPIEVITATAQGHVIGKRHFGRKAVAAGGGGGASGARELFDTLLLWRGRVKLDAAGRAQVEIPLNDSLTSFRIVAVAHSGAARFGHGSATIRTTQDLMLFSGLPPVVRDGDEFGAMVTVRNTTAARLDTKLVWAAYDAAASSKDRKRLLGGEHAVALAAGESRVVTMPVQVPLGARRLHWELAVTGPSNARDTLRVTQDVIEVHPVRVYQATLARLDKPVEFPIERPADSVPGRGGVRVEVMASLLPDLSPLREWFNYYPYTCLEQRASKAIGLRDDALWNAMAAALPGYLDRDGLARYFPNDDLAGSDVLTSYLVQVAHADGRELGERSLERMLEGLAGFATGRIVRGSALPTADLAIRKLAAIEALSRHGRATPPMLDAIAIDPPRWPTSALIDWIGILQRVEGIKDRAARKEQALSQLRARLNFQGTTMTFSTERNDALWWLMASADTNANRALIAVLEEPGFKDDVGRMVRGALGRQVRGAWGTTVANAWGTVAVERYVGAFENTPATGTTTASIGRRDVPIVVQEKPQTLDIPWPEGRANFALTHGGEGAPWAIVQSRAAIALKAPISTGYTLKRTVTPVERKDANAWTRGDVYRVSLEIDAQTDMTWVVVDDPIPSGAAILGSGLGRDSSLLTRGERGAGWAWPAYIERTHSAYRAYYEFVAKGRFKVEYTVRLNNAGRFELPAARVEALYAPEMLGELPVASIEVKP